MARTDFTISVADARILVATSGALIVPVVGHAGFSPESAELQARTIETFGRSLGVGKMVEVSIVDAEVGVPDAPSRAVLDAYATRIAPHYAAVGVVFAGTGFRAAMVRSVIASFQILGRAPYPQRVFADLRGGATFAAQHLHRLGALPANPSEVADVLAGVAATAVERGILSPSFATSGA